MDPATVTDLTTTYLSALGTGLEKVLGVALLALLVAFVLRERKLEKRILDAEARADAAEERERAFMSDQLRKSEDREAKIRDAELQTEQMRRMLGRMAPERDRPPGQRRG